MKRKTNNQLSRSVVTALFILLSSWASVSLHGGTQNIDGVIITYPYIGFENAFSYRVSNTIVIYQTRTIEGRLRSIYTPNTVTVDSARSALMIHGRLVSVPTFKKTIEPGAHGHFYENVFQDIYLTPNYDFGVIRNHNSTNNEIEILVPRTPKNGHYENNPDTIIKVQYTDQADFFIEDSPSTEAEAFEKFGKWIQVHPPRQQLIWLETEASAHNYERLPHYDVSGRGTANSASGMAYFGDFTEDGSAIHVTRQLHGDWIDTTHSLESPQAWLNGKLCPTAVAFKSGREFAAGCRRGGMSIKEEMVRVRDDEIRGTITAVNENSFIVEALDWDRNTYDTTVTLASNGRIMLDGSDTTKVAIEVGQEVRIFPERNKKRIVVLNEREPGTNSDFQPIAYFLPDKHNGTFNHEFTFDASHSYDLDGTITSYEWDFGDGNIASGAVVNHTFTDDSSYMEYKVTLTVSNDESETATHVKYITVVDQMRKSENILKENLHKGLVRKEWFSGCDFGTYPTCGNPDVYETVSNTVMNTNGGMNEFSGYIDVPQDGWYEFRLPGYDLQVWIGDWLVVDNINRRDSWGVWGHSNLKGMAYLEAGLHPITYLTEREEYWHNIIGWSGPGVELRTKKISDFYEDGSDFVTRTRLVLDEDVYFNPIDHNLPKANASVSATRGKILLTVDLNASASNGTIHTYNWLLYDNLTGDSLDMVEGKLNAYDFDTPGMYDLILHVKDTVRNLSSIDSVLMIISDTTYSDDYMGISVNFSSKDDTPLLPSYAVGDVPLLNWNNYQKGATETDVLDDSQYNPTSLLIKDIDMSDNRNSYLIDSLYTGDEIMRRRGLISGSTPLELSNIPSEYTEDGYDLYVYPMTASSGDWPPRNIFSVAAGADTFWIEIENRGNTWDGEYVRSSALTEDDALANGYATHVVFENFTSDSISITVNNQSAGFAGIQIVKEKVEGGLEEKADQEILFDKIHDKQTDDEPFEVYAKASSDLLIDYTIISGPATITDNLLTLDGTSGIVRIKASQAGNDFYNPAEKTQTFSVTDPAKTDQTISFVPVSDKINTHDDFEVTANATSGLDVTLEVVDGPATVSGNIITLTGETGQVTLKATQQGNDTYNPAPMQLERFYVSEEPQPGISLTFPYENSLFRLDETITITADVSLGGETLDEVAFYEGSNKLGSVSSAPYTFEWADLQLGSYTLSARLTTSEGTDIYSQDVNITVDQLTDVEVGTEIPEFSLYPNPTTGLIQITMDASSLNFPFVEVYTMQGKKVFSKMIRNAAVVSIDLSSEPKGMYLVKVGNVVQKVIKQ